VPSDWRMFRTLGALGIGADSYHLEVDRERGVLLAVTAVRDGQPFSKITTLAVRFDEPIPAETFQFKPPGRRTDPLLS
jgi:outer membrane lipoprotein-sorting protein